MTWSILARDPATGELGVAVATRFFAVGAICPRAEGGVGAIATQALVNPLLAIDGMARLRGGEAPAEALAALLAADAGRDHRQLHVLAADGRIAQHTGAACIDWCGHVAGPDVSVAGNMLAGPQVVLATRDAWLARAGLPMAERLIAALEAGEAAGGDRVAGNRRRSRWRAATPTPISTCGWTTMPTRWPNCAGCMRWRRSTTSPSAGSWPGATIPACSTGR